VKITITTSIMIDMAIRNESEAHPGAHFSLLVRCFVIGLGAISVWWGVTVFPDYFQESPIDRIATQIIAGDQFRPAILVGQQPVIKRIEKSAYCYPVALRSAAIIRLRMVEAAISGDNQHADLKSLGNAVRRSLSCAPADPFLWLVLFWVEERENGIRSENLKYLRMSYRLGPREGWIALKRNRVAFWSYKRLPPDLAKNAVDEFIGLIESNFIGLAVDIFIGPAWPERDLILASLIRVPDRQRQNFADALYWSGFNVNVPGVVSRDVPRWIKP
jgi:hypothetical protein